MGDGARHNPPRSTACTGPPIVKPKRAIRPINKNLGGRMTTELDPLEILRRESIIRIVALCENCDLSELDAMEHRLALALAPRLESLRRVNLGAANPGRSNHGPPL